MNMNGLDIITVIISHVAKIYNGCKIECMDTFRTILRSFENSETIIVNEKLGIPIILYILRMMACAFPYRTSYKEINTGKLSIVTTIGEIIIDTKNQYITIMVRPQFEHRIGNSYCVVYISPGTVKIKESYLIDWNEELELTRREIEIIPMTTVISANDTDKNEEIKPV